MTLFTSEDLNSIVNNYGSCTILDWKVQDASENIIGYLGEHHRLVINVQAENARKCIKAFVKCIPQNNQWKADYIRENNFFMKEFVTLKKIFKDFSGDDGPYKWRPKVLLLKEELFAFEDLNALGYRMPLQYSMSLEETKAVVKAMALFHAQSIIYEEQMTRKLNKPYRIWNDYKQLLVESPRGIHWRTAGTKAVVEYLKIYSKYKDRDGFAEIVHTVLPELYGKSVDIMNPSPKYRNTVIHRDLWHNNIFLKHDSQRVHAVIIDFQTVLYCPPMMDLSSFLYFNTRREFRERHLTVIVDYYIDIFLRQLKNHDLNNVVDVDRKLFLESYEENLIFGLTQASLIVPLVAMNEGTKTKLFLDPINARRISEVSRSNEIIQIAEEDARYRECLTELFDEIIERYIKF